MKTLRQIIALVLAAILATPAPLLAATINVPADQPTIQAGYNVANAGDVVRVAAGLYNERVSLGARDGSSGNLITLVADGQVICRGFDIAAWNHGQVIGFEITHNNTSFNNGVMFSGSNSRVGLIDLYIHGIKASGGMITCGGGTSLSYITYRGIRFEDVNIVNGVVIDNPTVAISTMPIATDHALIEYCTMKRVGDFIYSMGTNNIMRNNSMTQYTNEYWNFSPGVSFHIDGFQAGSDGSAAGTRHQVYEANWHGESSSQDSHAGIWQDTIAAGDINILYRGNINYRIGAGGIAVYSANDFHTYNNTFSECSYAVSGPSNGNNFFARAFGGDVPDRGTLANTIFYDNGNRSGVIDIAEASNYNSMFNLGYLAGSNASFSQTGNPLFVDQPNLDFRLQAGSPAINTGTNVIYITSASSSGTTFNINRGELLRDGYGMVEGDQVTINGTTTRVSSISGNAVTVQDAVTWTLNMPVYWGTDTTPDIGALPRGFIPLTAATLENTGGTTWRVTPNGDTRMVVFYLNGIPVSTVYDEPFETDIPSGTPTAKAYALRAQATPIVDATEDAGGSPVGGVVTSGRPIFSGKAVFQ